MDKRAIAEHNWSHLTFKIIRSKPQFCIECYVPSPIRLVSQRTCTSMLSPCVPSSPVEALQALGNIKKISVVKSRNRWNAQRCFHAQGYVIPCTLLLSHHLHLCRVCQEASWALCFLNKTELSFWSQLLLLEMPLNTYTSCALLALNCKLIWQLTSN